MIPVFIPMAIGQAVPQAVRDSIINQTVGCDITEVYSHGVVNSQGKRSKLKTESQIKSRSACVDLAIQGKYEYACIQDSDIEHLYKDNIEKMLNFLKINPVYAAVTLYSIRNGRRFIPSHIRQTCTLMRGKDLLHLKYWDHPKCICCCVEDSFALIGKKVGYLDEVGRVKDVERPIAPINSNQKGS